MKAHLSPPTSAAVLVDYHQDPREFYTDVIFQQNQFIPSTILQAIHKLDQSHELLCPTTSQYSMTELRKITWDVVNAEV